MEGLKSLSGDACLVDIGPNITIAKDRIPLKENYIMEYGEIERTYSTLLCY